MQLETRFDLQPENVSLMTLSISFITKHSRFLKVTVGPSFRGRPTAPAFGPFLVPRGRPRPRLGSPSPFSASREAMQCVEGSLMLVKIVNGVNGACDDGDKVDVRQGRQATLG